MRTEFTDPLKVKDNIAHMDIEKLRRKIWHIIKPNYNDEWLDTNKHFKEAAHEILRLLFEHK